MEETMESTLSVKFFVDGDIRRLGVDSEADFRGLQQKVASALSRHESTFAIYYDDDEGDRIRLTSQLEYMEAKRLQPSLLKLHIASIGSRPDWNGRAKVPLPDVPSQYVCETVEANEPLASLEDFADIICSDSAIIRGIGGAVASEGEETVTVALEGSDAAMEESECSTKLDMTLCEDVTFKDGTTVSPGVEFEKRWLVENIGNVHWPVDCVLVPIGSANEECGWTVTSVIAEGVKPGARATLSVHLVAPAKPGRCVGYWKLLTPNGIPVGSRRLWCDITVGSSLTRPATPELPPDIALYEGPYECEVNDLIAMGFGDVRQLLTLLQKHKGDTTRVVNTLLH